MKYIHILSLLTLAGGTSSIYPAVSYSNSLYNGVSSLCKKVMKYGWGHHALEALAEKAMTTSPSKLKNRCPDLTKEPYTSYIKNHQLPEESKQKIDAIMQRESVMRALTLLYHQPNIVQYWYAQSIFWWHEIHFTGSRLTDMIQYFIHRCQHIPSQRVFTMRGLNVYGKMGNLYHHSHTDETNFDRIINAEKIRSHAQQDNIHVATPQKWFYPLSNKHVPFSKITPPFLVVAETIDLSRSQAVPDTHPIRTWFTQKVLMTDLSCYNIRYTPCTTCTKKCTNQLHHDEFTIIDTEF